MTNNYIAKKILNYAIVNKLINSRNGLIGWYKLNKEGKNKRRKFEAVLNMFFNTKLDPFKNYTVQKKTGMLNFSLDSTDITCSICGHPKKYRDSYDGFINTYGKRDKEHLTLSRKIAMIKTKQTFISTIGVSNVFASPDFKQSNEQKNLLNFGVKNPKQKHFLNLDKMNKLFIEKKFIDNNGFIMWEEFGSFFNVSDKGTIKKYLKELEITFLVHPRGFKLDMPGILYYLKDILTGWYKIGITNTTIQERFGLQKLKNIKVIKIWSFELGKNARDLEKLLHDIYNEYQIDNDNFRDVGVIPSSLIEMY